jgi:hypothetical protein
VAWVFEIHGLAILTLASGLTGISILTCTILEVVITFWMYISSSLPQFPLMYVTSNAFIARGICATLIVDQKEVIGVACGRGLGLATTQQDRPGKRETNVVFCPSQYEL